MILAEDDDRRSFNLEIEALKRLHGVIRQRAYANCSKEAYCKKFCDESEGCIMMHACIREWAKMAELN